jgi:hypothetical protein
VFSLGQLMVVVLASRAVDVGRLCLFELRLIVAEVLPDEQSYVETCHLSLTVAQHQVH